MSWLPNMHRSGRQSQWKDVPPDERNQWQKTAARTFGIITPGNKETFKGAIASKLGIYCVKKNQMTAGLLLLGYGRLKDIRDGKRAEETETKSPLGEIADTFSDNGLLLSSLPVFEEQGLVSSNEASAFKAIIATKFVATGATKIRGREEHASRLAKIGMFSTWVGLTLRLGARSAAELRLTEAVEPVQKLSDKALQAGIGMTALASTGYVWHAFRPNH